MDVYGVLFKLSNNDVVDLWSNGQSATTPLSYGVGVMEPSTVDDGTVLDFQSGGVSAVPEPRTIWILGLSLGLLTLAARKRNRLN